MTWCNGINTGIDFEETFAITARFYSLRLLLALSASKKWQIMQLHVVTAFFNAPLEEEIYLQQPEGFIDKNNPEFVWKLHKAIYGLKQAPRQWNTLISSAFKEIEFLQFVVTASIKNNLLTRVDHYICKHCNYFCYNCQIWQLFCFVSLLLWKYKRRRIICE